MQDFEYTTECIIFDLLQISLYHGWLVDPQNQDEVKAVGKCSYNQLVEKIISNKTSEKQEEVRQGILTLVLATDGDSLNFLWGGEPTGFHYFN